MTIMQAASTSPAAEEFDFDIMTIGAGSGGVRGSRFAASYGGSGLPVHGHQMVKGGLQVG